MTNLELADEGNVTAKTNMFIWFSFKPILPFGGELTTKKLP